jgi:hypothetical protein
MERVGWMSTNSNPASVKSSFHIVGVRFLTPLPASPKAAIICISRWCMMGGTPTADLSGMATSPMSNGSRTYILIVQRSHLSKFEKQREQIQTMAMF